MTDIQRPSKTQRKKAMHDLQALGEGLVELSDDRLEQIELPDSLRDAVREAKRTRSHEGRRRQMQYVGKLMRRVDPEPIAEALAAFALGGAKDTLLLHQAENWRARLLADDHALTAWVAEHPNSDVQHMRQLIRGARQDAAAAPEQRSGRGFRELYQYLRRHLVLAAQNPSEQAP